MNSKQHQEVYLPDKNLLEEVEMLRKKVNQVVRLKQEVLELNYRLDRETTRLKAIQRFIEQGIPLENDVDFAMLVCESVIDLLECEVAIFWRFQTLQNHDCMTHVGLDYAQAEIWLGLRQWLEHWQEMQFPGQGRAPQKVNPPPLPPDLGLKGDFRAEWIMDSRGRPLAVVMACNTHHHPDFHEGFSNAGSVFSAFADEVGVMFESMRRRLTIISQVEKIRIFEDRLSTALSGSNIGLWDMDLESGKVFYSEQWKQQLGYAVDEVGDTLNEWQMRVHPDDLLKSKDATFHCIESPGSMFDVVQRMRHKRGHWVWINCRGYNISNPAAGVFRVVGIHIDVTEQKILEKRLLNSELAQRLAKERAERESAAKSAFLAAVSHEIRTPLNGMMAAFQMLDTNQSMDAHHKIVAMGQRAGRSMLKIIGDSLDIARIEAGRTELTKEEFDLQAVLVALKELEEIKASEKQLEFRLEVAPECPRWVMGDPNRLQQILTNLVENALKYTQRGVVVLTVKPGLLTAKGHAFVRFLVTDTGIGFSKEFRQIIFQPFSQEAQLANSGVLGIGLGLVITKELVQLKKGRIHAFSRVGVGSVFAVTLPYEVVVKQEEVKESVDELVLRRFRGRVLLVEDDEISGTLGSLMMMRVGLDVDLAVDGKQAIERAAGTRYDLIFLDYLLPIKSGIAVARELRATAHHASTNTPIIALTANARQVDKDECMSAGMNGFMVKPLFFETLMETLDEYLPEDV